MSDKSKLCKTCAHWKDGAAHWKDGVENPLGSRFGMCILLGGNTYYLRTEGDRGVVTRDEFGCCSHKGRAAGPFRAVYYPGHSNDWAFIQCGDSRTQGMPHEVAERLVEWLNERWTERVGLEAGE